MASNFWEKLPKPFFILAPMADVTDPAFRQIIAKYGKLARPLAGPDVLYTEFVSADGFFHRETPDSHFISQYLGKNLR